MSCFLAAYLFVKVPKLLPFRFFKHNFFVCLKGLFISGVVAPLIISRIITTKTKQ